MAQRAWIFMCALFFGSLFQNSSMCSESSSEIAILADLGALPEDEQESIGTCTKEKNVRAPASCSP